MVIRCKIKPKLTVKSADNGIFCENIDPTMNGYYKLKVTRELLAAICCIVGSRLCSFVAGSMLCSVVAQHSIRLWCGAQLMKSLSLLTLGCNVQIGFADISANHCAVALVTKDISLRQFS